jgi:RNA polymerase sigma-70 factor (ECF subfamily)
MLGRLQQGPDGTAWRRMVEMYSPKIRRWLRPYSLQDQDVEDLIQEVLTVVVRRLPEFKRQPQVGSFRRWLRTITFNCLRDFWRGQRARPTATGKTGFVHVLEQIEDPDNALGEFWDKEHDSHVTLLLLEKIRPRFEAKTWHAFQRVALEGMSVEQTAQELGLSANAVFIAKSRVLHLLRKEGKGLLNSK